MSGQSKKNTPAKVPNHVFIDQRPESLRVDRSRLVSSQARRFQSAGKRQQQRLSARSDAGYARSLVGWRSASSTPSIESQDRALSPKSRSPGHRKTRRDAEEEACEADLSLAIETGLRVDPFGVFPSSNTKTVMLMVDYHIHIWAPHKAGNFDDLMGYNTQLDLCWPVALQDDMLFDATIAVSRTAWVLAQGKNPSEDEFMLYHRGLAIQRLRQNIDSATPSCKEAVIFTIGRMISIAYMSNEAEAFVAHYEAFRKIADKYIQEHPNSEAARVIENRLESWKALHGYRMGQNLLLDRSSDMESAGTSQPRHSASPKRHMRAQSPTLLSGLDLSVSIAQSLKLLTQFLDRKRTPGLNTQRPIPGPIESCRRFREILRSCDELNSTDLQLCCALMAVCLQLHDVDIKTRRGEMSKSHQDIGVSDFPRFLSDTAKTFINKKLVGFTDSDEEKMTLTWSALVLGSLLLQQPDNRLRTKGHIIHLNLSLNLGLGLTGSTSREGDDGMHGWTVIESLLGGTDKMGSLWHPTLVAQWECDWQGSMRRQRRWEQQGVWLIGVPKKSSRGRSGKSRGTSPVERTSGSTSPATEGDVNAGIPPLMTPDENYDDVDIIEYLVLREARDSLPMVE